MKTIKRLFTIVCVLFFTCNLCWGQLKYEPSDRISDVHWSFKDSIISVSFHSEDIMDNIRLVYLGYRLSEDIIQEWGIYSNLSGELFNNHDCFSDFTFEVDTIGKIITMSSKMISWPPYFEYSEIIVQNRINFVFFYSPFDSDLQYGSEYIVEKSDYEKLTSCLDIQSNQLEYKYCLLSGIWVENQPQEGPYIQYTFSNNKMIKCEKFMNLK